jgi:hypothetical protein
MGRDAGRIMRAELEKMISYAGRVLAVTNSPGIDAIRARKTATSMWARCAMNASQHGRVRRSWDEAAGIAGTA